jgi:dihydroorotase
VRQRRCPAPAGRRQCAAAANAAAAADELVIARPDDWHLHVRDGAGLQSVVPHTAAHYGRAIIMPNLVPPVTTAAAAVEYRQRVLSAVPPSRAGSFTPLMTCYLTDNTPPEEVHRAKEVGSGWVLRRGQSR